MNKDLYIPDCLFDTDNDLEIPSLRLDRQPEFCEIPFVCFGEQARTFNMDGSGTLHFYTDDYRYSVIYEHPEKIMQHNPRNIVEPNFSVYSDTPIAFGLQAIYKKRFVARAMQEKGINVFVDLNVNSKFYKNNTIGVPVGYHSFCTRGYSDRLHYLEFEYQMGMGIAANNADKLLFVIYGGGNKVKQFAKEHHCVYVEQLVNVKTKQNKLQRQLEQINGTIAFTEQEFDVKHLVSCAIENVKRSQIADYTIKQIES